MFASMSRYHTIVGETKATKSVRIGMKTIPMVQNNWSPTNRLEVQKIGVKVLVSNTKHIGQRGKHNHMMPN